MLKQRNRKEFADLVDRSMIILVLKCDKCEAIVARILYPLAAKLDRSCSQHDHFKETGHKDYAALKHLVVYMSAADKKLADQLSKIQRRKFEEFLGFFKPNQDKKDDKPS